MEKTIIECMHTCYDSLEYVLFVLGCDFLCVTENVLHSMTIPS